MACPPPGVRAGGQHNEGLGLVVVSGKAASGSQWWSRQRSGTESENLKMTPGVICSFLVQCSVPPQSCVPRTQPSTALAPPPALLQGRPLVYTPLVGQAACGWVQLPSWIPAVLESHAEHCCTRSQADTEPPGGQIPWDQDSEVRALLPINPGCTSAYHCTVICIHLHPSPHPPHTTLFPFPPLVRLNI